VETDFKSESVRGLGEVKMKREKSCGFVAYTRVGEENHYLIIKGINNDVGFPKGHVESGESEIESAVRELREETGVEVEVIDGFRHEIEYKLPRTKDVYKLTVYFLGECRDVSTLARQESELKDARFIPYSEARESLTFDEARRMLDAAEHFVRNRE
jgi:8-oxo-dGTP pyrophosphatase MutT (NUDIX family)